LPNGPALGHDTTTTTTVGVDTFTDPEAPPLTAEVSDSYTQSNTYVSDVNGDGIPDIVSDGNVLFGYVGKDGARAFSANSADTPAPVGTSAP
jgi:hypothetical protein